MLPMEMTLQERLDKLLNAQRILEEKGCIQGKIHRFLLAARAKK